MRVGLDRWYSSGMAKRLLLTDFISLLRASSPDRATATAFIPRDADGVDKNNVLAVAFSGDGKVYHYRGSNYAIAERLELLPVYAIVRDDTGEHADHTHDEEEARIIAANLTVQDVTSASRWGGSPSTYSVKRVK